MTSDQRRYYDELWSKTKVVKPQAWAIWKTISSYAAGSRSLLEIGAGNRPRVPIAGSYFVDLSPAAMQALRVRAGRCTVAHAQSLPFHNEQFDLVCAFEIVEHVPDDRALLQEISRVLRPGGRFIFSVPLHMRYWSRHDQLAGHVRRYHPGALESLLADNELALDQYNVTLSPRNRLYRNATGYLASKFWRWGVALERSLALPIYTWLDRRRGIRWETGDFPQNTSKANNVILLCSKVKGPQSEDRQAV
jgi:SAM-dependent methyltransferase